MRMKTAKGIWEILGINLIPSDSMYGDIKSAIEGNNLTESYLQKKIGHLAPISINFQQRQIAFSSF